MYNKNKIKRILVLNRSFWPDIEATGQFLTELCEELAEKYEITVIAGCSYYVKGKFLKQGLSCKDSFNRIKIFRVRNTMFWKGNLIGRFINWFTYGVLAFIAALTMKPSVIIACTDPPFLGIIAMFISRLRGVPYIYNCRDLYPDVALGLQKINKGAAVYVFEYLNKKALCAASLVVPLGLSMKNRLLAKGIKNESIRVIPDWVNTKEIKPIPRDKNPLFNELKLNDTFIIMHSGNIGLSQDFSPLLQCLSAIEPEHNLMLVFIGEGAGKSDLKKKIETSGLRKVMFLPYQPKEMLSFYLSMADLHIITLKQGLAGAIVPSKMYNIMAAGRPYLAITDKESEPASLAKEYSCGLWAMPEDSPDITQKLNWALGHPIELEEMGARGRKLAEEKFDKEIVIKDWFELLK